MSLNSCAPACVNALANPVTNSMYYKAAACVLPSQNYVPIWLGVRGCRNHCWEFARCCPLSSRPAIDVELPPFSSHRSPCQFIYSSGGHSQALSWVSTALPMGAARANSREETISWLVSEKFVPKRSPYGYKALGACAFVTAPARLTISQPLGIWAKGGCGSYWLLLAPLKLERDSESQGCLTQGGWTPRERVPGPGSQDQNPEFELRVCIRLLIFLSLSMISKPFASLKGNWFPFQSSFLKPSVPFVPALSPRSLPCSLRCAESRPGGILFWREFSAFSFGAGLKWGQKSLLASGLTEGQ